eukprot:jgi/Ulvmu1/2988/UM015_0028.1
MRVAHNVSRSSSPRLLLHRSQPTWRTRAAAAHVIRELPKPLPPPPKQATVVQVLPYLSDLAFSEPRMGLRLFAALGALMVAKAAGLASPFFFKSAVDKLVEGSAASMSSSLTPCILGLLLYGGMRMVSQVTKEAQMPLFTPVSQAVSRRVAHHTFGHVLGLDIRYHLDRRTGELSRVLERGTRSTQTLFRGIVFTLLPTGLELLLVCATLGRLFNGAVAAAVAATFAIYVAWTAHYIRMSAQVRKDLNELDTRTSGKAVDALLNYETVVLFNNQEAEMSQYHLYLSQYQTAMGRIERLAALLNAGQAIILNAGIMAALIAAVTLSPGGVSAGDIVLIHGFLLQLWGPLQFLGWFFRELRQSLVDMEDFLDILRLKPSVKDGTLDLVVPGTHDGANGHGHGGTGHDAHSSAAGGVRGLSVEFKGVDFAYTEDRLILKSLSFSVAAGQRVAIVGPSGSGKSSTLKLIAALYAASGGCINIAGQDIRGLRQASLRQHLAVVPQETVLMNDTILENIRYGRLEASDEEVRAAAQLAHLDAAIQRMPDGFDTVVGERGLKLSGGEKQRVAIARAFLRNPLLLVCDEATSALDSGSEQAIMRSLDELAQGRTSIFVAHRLSTVMNCDKIFVMAEGQLVEQGSHQELMACGGVYADMWEMQVGEEQVRQDMVKWRDTCVEDGLVAGLAAA